MSFKDGTSSYLADARIKGWGLKRVVLNRYSKAGK